MFKTLQTALKVKEIRQRLLFTFLMLLVIRFGSQLPVPGTDPEYISSMLENMTGDSFNFFTSMTGGSFEDFSIFALSITPYITSSIIMQLMTIAIPKLEELQKEGADGRKKIAEITRYVTVALALIQSLALSIGLGNQGLLDHYTWYNVAVCVITLTAGSACLMWIGERITENGIGNGISVVLVINIISRIPDDAAVIYTSYISGKSVAVTIVILVVVLAILAAIIAFTVLLNAAIRKIPVQYSQKVQGRRSIGGQSSFIPLKVNTAGVIPVIFASSIMSFPAMISQFFGGPDLSTFGGQVIAVLSSSYWFRSAYPLYSIGVVIYMVLVIAFAYFYTSITFNPIEVSTNIKRSGGFIPGIRPGKPTSDYLSTVVNRIVLIGAIGLLIVALIPIFISGFFGISRLTFLGTSLIIIVSVILESLKQIEGKMVSREYDSIF